MTLGRLVLPGLRWRDETGFGHEQPSIDRALGFGAGGFIVFGGTREAVRDLTRDLEARAGRPLLIGADLERGRGSAVPRSHRGAPARCVGIAGRSRAGGMGRGRDRGRSPIRRGQLGLCPGCGSRPRRREPDRPDPFVRRRPGPGLGRGDGLDPTGVSGPERWPAPSTSRGMAAPSSTRTIGCPRSPRRPRSSARPTSGRSRPPSGPGWRR